MSPLDAQATELVYPKVLDPQSNRPATISLSGAHQGAGLPVTFSALRSRAGPRPSTGWALLTLDPALAQNPAALSLHLHPWSPASQPWSQRVLLLKPHKFK